MALSNGSKYLTSPSEIPVEDSNGSTRSLAGWVDGQVYTYETVADMVADEELTAGSKARTLGYYSPGDGGGNDYEIVAAGTGTDDGGSFIDLSGSGLQANLINANKVMFLPDITYLSSVIQEALLDGHLIRCASYLPDKSSGGGVLRWRPELPKSLHDGVLFFSLTVPMFSDPSDTQDYRGGAGETDPGGVGVMELVQGEIIYDAIVGVPTLYSDLQSAVDDLYARIRPVPGVIIDIVMESGFSPSSGINVASGDYRHFRVSSVDAVVKVSQGFPDDGRIIYAYRADAPTLNTVFDMELKGDGIGGAVYLYQGSSILVTSGSGAQRAAGAGLHLNQSCTANAINTSWTNCMQREDPPFPHAAVMIQRNSDLVAEGIDVSNSGTRGLNCRRRSRLVAPGAVATGCAGYGLYVIRGEAFVNSGDFSGGGDTGILVEQASTVSARGVTVSGCAGNGVEISDASRADLNVAQVNNNGGDGILVSSSNVSAASASSSENIGYGVRALSGSTVSIYGGTTNNNGASGIIASAGSSVVGGAESKNNSLTDISIANGSFIYAGSTETTNGVGGPSTDDIPSGSGGFNNLSGRGVIFS